MTETSIAYDLSRFETSERKQKTKQEVKVITSKKKDKRPALIVSAFCLFLVLVSVLIYSKVKLTEVNDLVIAEEAALAELKGEETRLSLELEGKTSFGTIEEYATEKLGLSKANGAQIEYIDLSGGNKIESNNDVGMSGMFNKIKGTLKGFVEYIGF